MRCRQPSSEDSMVHSPLCRNSDYHSIRKKSKRKKKILVSGGSNTLYWIPCDDHGPMDSINRHQKLANPPRWSTVTQLLLLLLRLILAYCSAFAVLELKAHRIGWREDKKEKKDERRRGLSRSLFPSAVVWKVNAAVAAVSKRSIESEVALTSTTSKRILLLLRC